MYDYTTIDGERVESNIAAQFALWAADFHRETGKTLHVSSGVRTVKEQQDGYDNYRAGHTKVKWAKPSESSHCEIGPAGPRATDIRDSGSDAGVTVKGSARWNAAVRLGKKYGFTWGGWGVPDSEGWHFENHIVKIGGSAKPTTATEREEDDMLVNLVGKAGSHSAGLYYIANGAATRLGNVEKGFPTVSSDAAARLAGRVSGIKGA